MFIEHSFIEYYSTLFTNSKITTLTLQWFTTSVVYKYSLMPPLMESNRFSFLGSERIRNLPPSTSLINLHTIMSNSSHPQSFVSIRLWWTLKGFLGNPKLYLGFKELPCASMVFNDFQWTSNGASLNFYELLRISMNFHDLVGSSLNFKELLS